MKGEFQGTFVVHADQTSVDIIPHKSTVTRRSERKASRRSKRRSSFGDSPTARKSVKSDTTGSVYDVLLGVIFALTPLSERRAHDTFVLLTSMTAPSYKLYEDTIVILEEAFSMLHPSIGHLFLSFVGEATVRDSAEYYLDIDYIVRVVDRIVKNQIRPNTTDAEIRERLEPLNYLYKIVKRRQKRLTI